MSTMEAEQQKLNYPKCVCGWVCVRLCTVRTCVCVCLCVCVCVLSTQVQYRWCNIIYLYSFLDEHYIIDTSGCQRGRDARAAPTLKATLELKQRRQPETLQLHRNPLSHKLYCVCCILLMWNASYQNDVEALMLMKMLILNLPCHERICL